MWIKKHPDTCKMGGNLFQKIFQLLILSLFYRKNVRIGSQIMSCSLSPKVTSVFANHVTFKLQNKKVC